MFSFVSIQQYHQDLLSNSTTCVQAVEFYLQQIKANEQLNAYVNVYGAEALARAKQLDDSRSTTTNLKMLHGVVVSIKDVICYKNHPTTAASKMLHNFTSIYNATVVEKLLDAGAILIGSTNCDEFAMGSSNETSHYGVVKNAVDNTKVAGGSSGGSAVSVQAKLCMVAIGSDTGGSVRQPADYCDVVGLKPTYGRISRYGLIAYASSFDQIGILANSVEDCSIALQAISGADAYDTTLYSDTFTPIVAAAKTHKKIAYFKEAIESDSLDVEIKAAFLAKITALENEGHTVTKVDFPLMPYIVPTYYILTTAEASSNLNRYDGVKFGYNTAKAYKNLNEFYALNRVEGFGKEVQKRIMLGTFVLSSGYYDAYYTKAQQVRQLLRQFIEVIFADYDFILMPNVPATAPSIGDAAKDAIAVYLADVYTVLANLTGIPAIALPLATHSNGMPFGIQLLARHKEEATMLDFASNYMVIR